MMNCCLTEQAQEIIDKYHTDLRTVTGFQIQGRDYTRLFYDQVQP